MNSECNASISYDGDYAESWNQRKAIGRLATKCWECNDPIPAGTAHTRISMLTEGERRTYRICAACQTIADEFCDDGQMVGALWESMSDSVFDEGAPLQACLNRVIGVAAKTKIRDAWIDHKRSRGEL